MMKNYYAEIDKELTSYELHKPWHQHSLDWIADRISWCWTWKHITEEQMENFTERFIKIIKEN